MADGYKAAMAMALTPQDVALLAQQEAARKQAAAQERELARQQAAADSLANAKMFSNMANQAAAPAFDPRHIPRPTDMTSPNYAGDMWLYLRQQGHSSRAIADAMQRMNMGQRIADAQRDKYMAQFQMVQTPQERDRALAMMAQYAPPVAKTLAPRTPSYLNDWMAGKQEAAIDKKLAAQREMFNDKMAQQLELANARLAARSGGGRSPSEYAQLRELYAENAYNDAIDAGKSHREAIEAYGRAYGSFSRNNYRNASGQRVNADGLTSLEQEGKNLREKLLAAARAGDIAETGELLNELDYFRRKNSSKLDKDDDEAMRELHIVANYLREKALAEQTYKGESLEQLLAKNPNLKLYRDEIPLETKMRYRIY